MAVELWIDDGTPWYLSPDIWAVPSDDPNDPPGTPFENVSAYVWARVHNRGTTAVSAATVNFYWADPSTAITRATAHPIGTSSVGLAAGETKDVLCVTPWIPQYVNSGHECLIAEAFAPSDPLPPHAPSDPFHVPTDRHVAQRNISVGQAAGAMTLVHPFLIGGLGGRFRAREDRIRVRARRADLSLLKPLTRSLGLERLPEEAPELEAFGLRPYRCGDPVDEVGKPVLELEVAPGRQRGVALALRTPEGLEPGQAALFLVEQLAGDEEIGGVALLVLGAEPRDVDPRHGRKD